MKIFFVGDFNTETGPAIANRMLITGLKGYPVLYSNCKSKPLRIVELILKSLIADTICFCSYSQLNYIGIKICKILKKKTFYIMHGYRTYEYKINHGIYEENELLNINNKEKELFRSVDKIYCVSKKLMEFMRKEEPEFIDKFDYNYNGIYFEKLIKPIKNKKTYQIITIGGGMKQKNILTICKAIDLLNRQYNYNLKLIVIGLPYTEKDKICSYNFVTYYDKLEHDKVLGMMAESSLYIQNSTFETFGLSVLEAITLDCNLLLSKNIGAIDLFTNINEDDIIYDTNNKEEISKKIYKLIHNSNYEKLQSGLMLEQIEYKTSAISLYNKVKKYMEDR